MEQKLDLQKLNFFTEGNTFTGSQTKDRTKGILLRYRVKPDRENEKLLVWSWLEDVCFEKAQNKAEVDFPLNEDGLVQVRTWLDTQFRQL